MIIHRENPKDGQWHKWYAWYPVHAVTGEFIWLEFIMRRWNPNQSFSVIDPFDPGAPVGGFEYELGKP